MCEGMRLWAGPQRAFNSLLKGTGDETLFGVLHVMPKNTPITH